MKFEELVRMKKNGMLMLELVLVVVIVVVVCCGGVGERKAWLVESEQGVYRVACRR